VKIGFIGAGSIAQAVGTHLAKVGHDVMISNSRGPDSLTALATPLGLTAGTVKEAVDHEVVFLAVPWSKVPGALRAAGPLTDRVVVDTTNPLEAPTFTKADLGGRTSSEVVADLVPHAKVIKAFNHMTPESYGDGPAAGGGHKVLFHSSDHPDAHTVIAALIESLDYVPINLGTLAAGGALHEFPGGPLPARTFIELLPTA
jgi:8-hydroxy-5-deazaflavin:NADPH oxidoreductase